MHVQAVSVRNFRALQNVALEDLPGFTVLVGANGSGKSTFVDVFGFLRDCLVGDVRSALQARGGFSNVISRGFENEAIVIELKVKLDFLEEGIERLVTYHLEIESGSRGVSVAREYLRLRRAQNTGSPYHILDFRHGEGEAVVETADVFNPEVSYQILERDHFTLDKPYGLAIKALGQLRDFNAARQFRDLIENWSVSDFHIADARGEPDAAPAEHLSRTGDNLALYAQFLKEEHPIVFQDLLEKMARRVPGIDEVSAEDTGDGRVVLRFRDSTFDRAFIARSVSDGTVKMFAYLALLADPDPHPLLCVEEPENQLYPSLLGVLAEEFAEYAHRRKGEGQVIATTHSPDFLNAVTLKSVYYITKKEGFSTIRSAASDPNLSALVEAGDLPGWLWREGAFPGVNPS